LILTQDLQLFLKLIQMTTIELSDYLEEQLIENPALEEVQEINDKGETLSENEVNFELEVKNLLPNTYDDSPFRRDFNVDSEDDYTWENNVSSTESLIDYLRWQLELSDLTPFEKHIASIIIGNINEHGYLEAGLDEIVSMLANSIRESNQDLESDSPVEDNDPQHCTAPTEFDMSTIEGVLKKIQSSFDPPGVCARNLKESLIIQLKELGYQDDGIETRIVNNHLDDISNKRYDEIASNLGITEEEAEKAANVISKLEPKPGRPFYSKDSEKYIVPDFYIYKVGDELQIQLNREIPKVRVSHYYKNLINKGKLPTDVKKYIKEKLESAQRIIKCLEERDSAIKKVITKIVDHQKDFFEHGREYIRPLRLKDIAQDEDVKVHESTVSRITSRRYIYTPQGLIELKSLFSRKIETSVGENISFERVKSILRDIIANESPESPYSDEDISRIFERKKIKLARRTISKYRKMLNIPPSHERISIKE
ncbi:MAG: RNA polymerase factor sigma-54, partial [Deltaproteobacteria bacterium]|nr:RNA polymerase factor sigma-54 [Deltaproteobacteria bacterium]